MDRRLKNIKTRAIVKKYKIRKTLSCIYPDSRKKFHFQFVPFILCTILVVLFILIVEYCRYYHIISQVTA